MATTIITRADDVTNLVIKLKTGNETVLSLDSNPVITFDGEYLYVRNDDASFSFPIADIAGFRQRLTTRFQNPCLHHGWQGHEDHRCRWHGVGVFQPSRPSQRHLYHPCCKKQFQSS